MKTQHTHTQFMATTLGRLASMGLMLGALSIIVPTTFADQLVPHHASAAGALIAPPSPVPPSEEFPFGSAIFIAEGHGVGTYEGQFTEYNEYEVGVQLTVSGPVTVIRGTLTVTTANGNQLFWEFNSATPGVPDPLAPFPFVATPELVGGTGRFNGATGTATIQGILYPDGSYEYVADGLISCIGSNLTK